MHSTIRTGFTLVEMAVVLVIIGLITGGIFVGTTVVRNSEIQTILSDYTKYSAAANQFTLQYGNPPGDLGDATNYWGDNASYCSDPTITDGNPGTCNGNGDGYMGPMTREVNTAWPQLQLAKLIAGGPYNTAATYTGGAGIGTVTPAARLAGSTWMFYNNSNPVNYLGTSAWFNQDLNNLLSVGQPSSIAVNTNIAAGPILTTTEAWKIDSKIDDGMPATGRIVSLKPSNGGWSSPVPNCATTAVDATAVYNVTYGEKACSLMMSLSTK